MALIITLLIMVAVVIIFVGIFLTLGPDNALEDRLAQNAMMADADADSGRDELKRRMNEQFVRGKWGGNLNLALFQAGVKLTAVEFVAINLGLTVAFAALGWLIGRNIYSGLGLGLLAASFPRIWLKRRKDQRLGLFQDQLPDVLNLLVGSLRSGYGLMQALRLVSQEMPSPSAEEYERVTQEIAFGVSTTKALGRLVERMESADLEMVVAAIQVQHEVGGNLGDILATIAGTIRERIQIQGEVRAITSMQRATGYMLAALPFILGVILLMFNADYMMRVFVMPWVCIPGFAVFSVIVGLIMISRMVKSIEV
ncbi:MAG: type II secretion system F family protein [Caldilineaceae bacterium]|nr:type II secretion system F family protein [Caldilineaceae bacterium]